MAKTQTPKFVELLKTNVGWWFLLGMAALLLIRLLLSSLESGSSPSAIPQPAPGTLLPKISEDKLHYLMAKKIMTPWVEPKDKTSMIYPLATYNMFDPKLVQNAAMMERTANDQVSQAITAFRNGNLLQARDLVLDALAKRPNHLQGQQLLGEIEQKLKGQTGATTGTLTRAADRPTTQAAPLRTPGGPPGGIR